MKNHLHLQEDLENKNSCLNIQQEVYLDPNATKNALYGSRSSFNI